MTSIHHSAYLVDFFVMSFLQFGLGANETRMLAHAMFPVSARRHAVVVVVMVTWTPMTRR